MSPYRRRPPPASHVCGLFLLPEIIGAGQAGAQARRSRAGGGAAAPPVQRPSASVLHLPLAGASHRHARRGVVRVRHPRCVSAPAVAAASPTRGFPPRTLAPGRDVFGWLLAPRFVREGPRGQQVGESQFVGQVQQRHLVPEMGPRSASIPTPYGVGIGPETASDLRPRQPRLLLEQLQSLREVGRHDVDYSAVVNWLSRHCPILRAGRKPQAGRRAERKRPQPARPGALGETTAWLAQGLRRPPPLCPCVRPFFVALYRPGPLTVGANSSDNLLPSLVPMAPSPSQSSIPATGPPGSGCGTSANARSPRPR